MPATINLRLAIRDQGYDTAAVYIRFSAGGTMHYVPTGERVLVSQWDAKEGRVKTPPRLAAEDRAERDYVNARLQTVLDKGRAALRMATEEGKLFTTAYLKQALAPTQAADSAAPTDMMSLWQYFIDGAKAGHILAAKGRRIKKATLIAYQQAYNSVKAWAAAHRYKPEFETFTRQRCEQYTAWYLAKSLTHGTINSRVKNIKVFCKWAEVNGYTNVAHYKNLVRPTVGETDFVYLTYHELAQLAQAELPAHLERVRDMFLLQAETGLRYSDIANLKPEHRQGGRLVITTIKTEDKLTIPLSPAALAIFDKYAETGLPKVVQAQVYNRELKEACHLAGIDTPAPTTVTKKGFRFETTTPKWQRVSSHTARRTFIIHALERGIRPEVLQKVTGHKDIKTLMRYVKITANVVEAEFARAWQSRPSPIPYN